MGRGMRRVLVGSVAFAMVLAACTPAQDAGSASSDVTTTAANEPGAGSDGSGDTASPGSDTALPILPILSPSAELVAAGATITVTTDARREGSVVMRSEESQIAEAVLVDGSASLTVPPDTPAGVYRLETDDDEPAVGMVGVAESPSLWISTSRWTVSDEPQQARIATFGIPEDLTVALELTAPGQAPERLVPHRLAGLGPIPFGSDPGEGLARGTSTINLPAGFIGTARLIADTPENLDVFADTEDEPAYASAELRIRRCDEPTGIMGDLGASGAVSAMWLGNGVEKSGASTSDGSFTLATAPGSVIVTATTGPAQAAASPASLQVKCGEILDVGDMSAPVDTGPAPGTYLGGLTLDDAWLFTATSTGDIAFEHEGTTECSADGGEVELQFISPGMDTHLYYVTIPEFAGSGKYEAEFRIIDVLEDGDSTGPAEVEIEQGRIDDVDVVGGEFSAAYDGALGGGTITGRFTCGFFTALETGHAVVGGAATPGGVFASPRFSTGVGSDDGTCRKAFLTQVGPYENGDSLVHQYATRTFFQRPTRVEAISLSDVAALLDLRAAQELTGTPDDRMVEIADIAGMLDADYLITFRAVPLAGVWYLSVVGIDLEHTSAFFRDTYESATEEGLWDLPVADDLGPAIDKVGICGEVEQKSVDVASGEEEEVTYKITDLAGEPADATVDELTSKCGTFEPKNGDAANGEFTTTFTGGTGGCTDDVTMVARTDAAVGEVTTEKDEDASTTQIAIPTFSYRYVIDYKGSTAVEGSNMPSYSSGGTAFVHAESEGEFFVDSELGEMLGTSPLIGAGRGAVTGGDPQAPCAVFSENGVDVHPQAWAFDGGYQVLVSGDLLSGTPEDGGRLKLSPGGYRMLISGSWSDPDCFPPGEMTNEIFSYATAAVFVLNPAILVAEASPDGYDIDFKADGSKTKRTWPITLGDGTGSVTIEVWQSDAGTS